MPPPAQNRKTGNIVRAGSVQLPGIGKLKLGQRAERQGRNPSTREAITIKARKIVKDSGAKPLKTPSNDSRSK